MADATNMALDTWRDGVTGTLTTIAGTTCPCMASRDSANPSYSADWHRRNTGAAACNGTGKITTTPTTINVKFGAAYSMGTAGAEIKNLNLERAIGELDLRDMIVIDWVNSSGTRLDFASYNWLADYITLNSLRYKRIYHVDYEPGSGLQLAILRRIL